MGIVATLATKQKMVDDLILGDRPILLIVIDQQGRRRLLKQRSKMNGSGRFGDSTLETGQRDDHARSCETYRSIAVFTEHRNAVLLYLVIAVLRYILQDLFR